MKRIGYLYTRICSFENIHAAWRKARKGKRRKVEVMAFEADLDKNLHSIRSKLERRTWQPGPYRTFSIRDPKPRLIAAAPFADRVVHHAIVNVLEPIFEPTFIFDLYSNRKGKGTHAAVRRAQRFARKQPYVLHADVYHYFKSINRESLLGVLARKIKCVDTLGLVRRLIDVRQPGLETGLPLGNQSSQFFANVYLSPLDHFIKEELGCKGYIRYVDDMFLFGDSKDELWGMKHELEGRLADFHLALKPQEPTLYRVEDSFPCLGYRVFPEAVLMRRDAIFRFRRKAKSLVRQYAAGHCNLEKVRSSLMGSMGHMAQATTGNLRTRLMAEAVFQRAQ